MSLGDALLTHLPRIADNTESTMLDTCRITRAGAGKGPWNETTMQYDPPARTTVYSGRCKFRLANAIPVDSHALAGDWSTLSPALVLPLAETGALRRGDIAECLTSAMDPSMVGVKVTIEGPQRKSIATARRLICSEGV